MSLSNDMLNQVFSLPAGQRYELAQQLLDSIDEGSADQLDEALLQELQRRREEMQRGDESVADWRAALTAIQQSISTESRD